MSRQAAAVARLEASRARLRAALVQDAAPGPLSSVLLQLMQLVQRHPLAAAGLAMIMGGLSVRIKPWRWLLKAELWSAVLPGLMAALTAAPLGAWADVLSMFLRPAQPGPKPSVAPEPPVQSGP